MPKPKPTCTLSLQFISGRKYRIDLYRLYGWGGGKLFSIKFTDHDGQVKNGSATVSKLVDRLRRLIVKEI